MERRIKEQRIASTGRSEGDECPVAAGAPRISLKARGNAGQRGKSAAARSRISRRDKGAAVGHGKYGGFGDKLAAAARHPHYARKTATGEIWRRRPEEPLLTSDNSREGHFIDRRE